LATCPFVGGGGRGGGISFADGTTDGGGANGGGVLRSPVNEYKASRSGAEPLRALSNWACLLTLERGSHIERTDVECIHEPSFDKSSRKPFFVLSKPLSDLGLQAAAQFSVEGFGGGEFEEGFVEGKDRPAMNRLLENTKTHSSGPTSTSLKRRARMPRNPGFENTENLPAGNSLLIISSESFFDLG